jgi:hypothetical protein
MRAIQVVSHPPSELVELDARTDDVSGSQLLIQRGWQVFGFEQLQLQAHRQAILRAAIAQPHQTFPAFEHGATGQGLQSVEIGQSGGIGLLAPVPPQAVDRFAQGLIGQHALRLDAGADGVRDKGLDACRCPGIAAYQIAALGGAIRSG